MRESRSGESYRKVRGERKGTYVEWLTTEWVCASSNVASGSRR